MDSYNLEVKFYDITLAVKLPTISTFDSEMRIAFILLHVSKAAVNMGFELYLPQKKVDLPSVGLRLYISQSNPNLSFIRLRTSQMDDCMIQ